MIPRKHYCHYPRHCFPIAEQEHDKLVTAMASIPLHCNICPKEPDFSDISHLLTHVNSKAHLSHHKNTELRAALNDPTAKGKKDAYQQWYDRYQIEKLLSERLAAKGSRDTSSRYPSKRAVPRSATDTKERKVRKKQVSTTASRRVSILNNCSFLGMLWEINFIFHQVNTPSPAKCEGVIDPQLSQSHLAEPAHPHASTLFQSFQHDTAARHRAYIPRMGAWHNASPPTQEDATQIIPGTSNPPQSGCGSECNANDDDDYFQSFLRSPTRTAYPDPAEFGGLPVPFSPFKQEQQKAAVEFPQDLSSETEDTGLIQSPVLKGVKWPGMSLFDSASLEAQRRRNQKKDESIIEQMQIDSAAVEQLERIYWPNGILKKERLITGNVESSPPRDLTPPPVPTRRQRTKANKAVLRDLSTNGLKVGKRPRQRKTAARVSGTQASNLQQLSEKALATLDESNFLCPRSTHIGYNAMDEEESERQLTFGATNSGRRRDFEIFSDDMDHLEDYQNKPASKVTDISNPQTAHGHHILHSHGSSSTRRKIPLATCQPSSRRRLSAQPGRPLPDSLSPRFGKKFIAALADDGENLQPILDGEGRVDDSAGPSFQQRITQRYFSVTGNQAPQYFSTLPPQMEFGGLAEPKYYGTTLNPLNTHLYSQQFSPYTAQTHFHYPTSTDHQDNGTQNPGKSSSVRTSSARKLR